MARIDNPAISNPFGWRLADLTDPTTDPVRARQLWQEVLVCEAEEIAHGYRHLTIVHGDPIELAASRHLSAFYETLQRLASGCDWVRVRGDADYVTVTVRGPHADDVLAVLEDAAVSANPGEWTLVASAMPPLS